MMFNKLKKPTAIMLLTILSIGGALAQNPNFVVGRVTDAESGEAMPFVNVALMRPADTVFMRGATTNEQGFFGITDVDTGSYLMQVSFVGYQTYTESLSVHEQMMQREIKLQRGTTLQEVKVTAERPLYAMDGEKNMYNTKEDASIQTGTASDALQNAPGVEVDAEGNITLRGVSSVEIWINDQPSHMNEEALKQYIKTLPANAIERIEVITNPSARYSTSGGVINIVTNQKVTRNELLCFGLHATTTPAVSPWVSYVWANEKFDFNFYLNGRYNRNESSRHSETRMTASDGTLLRTDTSDNANLGNGEGGYAGFNFNWNIDSMTSLSAWMGAYPGWNNETSTGSNRHFEYFPTLVDHSTDTWSDNRNFYAGGYMGAWFDHRYDTTGRRLHASMNGNVWGSRNRSHSVQTYANPALWDKDRHIDNSNWMPSASMDMGYTLPLKHQVELDMGAEVGYTMMGGSNWEDSLDAVDGLYHVRPENTYDERWHSASAGLYTTVQKRWGGLTLKLGVRGKYEHLAGNNISDFQSVPAVDTAYFGLIPSVHLSYSTKDFHNFSFSYTRRYSTPDAEDLSTFINYSDYSYSTGNPNLLLSYTHNFEAAWNKYFMKFGSIGLQAYYRANTNEVGYMTAVGNLPYYGMQQVNYVFPDNIGSSHTEGIEANVTYRPTAFVNVRLNASLFNYGYDYQGFADNMWSYSFRLNVWAKVWNRLELFANARYSSPTLGLYSIRKPHKSIDFGASSDFFDRRLSLFLNVNDIFGWAEWGNESTNPLYTSNSTSRWKSTYVSLGATLRFGKMELESKARQGATDTNMPQMQ